MLRFSETMKTFSYPATILKDEDGSYQVTFRDLPECFTYGATADEAQHNASEALSALLDSYLAHNKQIPEPSQRVKDATYILPDAKTQAALAFREALRASDKTVAEIARAVNTSWPSIARLEDAQHWPTLKLLEKAIRATGKRLVVSIE